MIAPTPRLYRCASCNGTGPAAQYKDHVCHRGRSLDSVTLKAALPAAPRPRRGAMTEIALHAAFIEAGFIDLRAVCPEDKMDERDLLTIFVAEYTWAPHDRAWRADFAFPVADVLVEIEGDCHAVKKQRRVDVVRRQEAEKRGWRVVSVLPEQVRDGTGVDLVRAALARGTP